MSCSAVSLSALTTEEKWWRCCSGKFHPSKKFQELPMLIEDTKPFILTPISIDQNNILTAKLLVDTGASHSLLLEPTSDKRIVVPQNRVSTVLGRALGGVITVKPGEYNPLNSVSSNYQRDYPFSDSNSYLDTLKHSITFRNGSIGGEILSRFTVVLNFPRENCIWKKNADFKSRSFKPERTGNEGKGARLDVYEVIDVRSFHQHNRPGYARRPDYLCEWNVYEGHAP